MLPEIINFKSPGAGRELAGKDPICIPAYRMQAGVISASTLDSDTATPPRITMRYILSIVFCDLACGTVFHAVS